MESLSPRHWPSPPWGICDDGEVIAGERGHSQDHRQLRF